MKEGGEYGTTTGRMRKTNWLDLDKLISAIKISGTTIIIISKVDVIKKVNIFKLYHQSKLQSFNNFNDMRNYIDTQLKQNSCFLNQIIYSDKVELTSL